MAMTIQCFAQSQMSYSEFKSNYSTQVDEFSKCVWTSSFANSTTTLTFDNDGNFVEQRYVDGRAKGKDLYAIDNVTVYGHIYTFQAVWLEFYKQFGKIIKFNFQIDTHEKTLKFMSSEDSVTYNLTSKK